MEFMIKMFTDTSSVYFWVYWLSVLLSGTDAIFNWIKSYKIDIIYCYRDNYKPLLTVGYILSTLIFSLIPIINTVISVGTIITFSEYIHTKCQKVLKYGIVSKKYDTKNSMHF